ncbi:hypothetical protein IFR04_015012 [Cadophora malorum]|uniref:Uncharacterized protein n=1 Tax=Cadophora malorum TaxID=108018 RepID=A0A8H7T1N2_9HELO|nr:hypothetical protein IFR04_015012 [Cadophora malorum]
MQLTRLIKLVAPVLAFVATTTAVGNCKCQDHNGGQYNDYTEECCYQQVNGQYHGDQHHQCSSWTTDLMGIAFDYCCKEQAHDNSLYAFCWN